MNEEDGGGLVGEGVKEEVKDMHTALNSSSLSSYLLKPSHLLTQGFENNRTTHENLFKHICNFGSQAEWREGRRVVIYYIDVDATKYQCCLLNTMPLDCIVGYIMDDDVGNRAFKRMPQRRLNFIDGYILS